MLSPVAPPSGSRRETATALCKAGAKGRSQALVPSGPGGCRGCAWASILDDHLATHPPELCLRASRRRLRHFGQRCLPLMSPASTRTPQSASVSSCFTTCTRPSSPRASEKLAHVSATAPSLRVLNGECSSDESGLCSSRSLALIGPWPIRSAQVHDAPRLAFFPEHDAAPSQTLGHCGPSD